MEAAQNARVEGFDRLPVILTFREAVPEVETYGFASSQGTVTIEGQRLVPRDRPSDTVYLFLHPVSALHLLPMPIALADEGLHVLCGGTRYCRNDSALIMEKVAYDLGMYVRHARETLGYRRVILVGWSGGGAVSLFYQAQALVPRITHTAAGDPYDLTRIGLPPADGVIFIAAHLSRAESLTEWLDPSVLDEADPDRRDPELDIYDPSCPHKPPFTREFLDRFRAAQRARSGRITARAQALLARLRERNDGEAERAFVVHRTMCDPRWIDPSVDPNGRRPNWCYLGDPRAVNVGPIGLARYTCLRSWLSQWAIHTSQAKGPENAARIRGTPVLQIVNEADDAVPATHNPVIRAALATDDKEWFEIEGATHYYQGQPAHLRLCIDKVVDWSRRKGLLAA